MGGGEVTSNLWGNEHHLHNSLGRALQLCPLFRHMLHRAACKFNSPDKSTL